MNKKLFILVLVVTMLSASLFAMGGGEQVVAPRGDTQVILGSSTQVNADFFSGWTNSATNKYLKDLMSGYETVCLR